MSSMQFLVVKDGVLKRQRQYNINQLLDKLMHDFEEHFKIKLLSVADGTFDGVFSGRFKGSKLVIPGKKLFLLKPGSGAGTHFQNNCTFVVKICFYNRTLTAQRSEDFMKNNTLAALQCIFNSFFDHLGKIFPILFKMFYLFEHFQILPYSVS